MNAGPSSVDTAHHHTQRQPPQHDKPAPTVHSAPTTKARELRVVVRRIDDRGSVNNDDILGRMLSGRDTESDCVQAETSRHLDDAEVIGTVQDRQAELTLTCGVPMPVGEPDVTSTPRPHDGSTYTTPTQGPRRPRMGRSSAPRPARISEELEILRSDKPNDRDQPWNISLEMDGQEEDHAATIPSPSQGAAFSLDPTGISNLARTLQDSLPHQPAHDNNNNNKTHRNSSDNSMRSSTPNELDPEVTLRDGDESMEPADVSTGSRKRTRGGRKHKKNGTPSINSDEVGPKQAKTSPPGTQSSGRKPGRPPGSGNKKYQKERSSTQKNNSGTDGTLKAGEDPQGTAVGQQHQPPHGRQQLHNSNAHPSSQPTVGNGPRADMDGDPRRGEGPANGEDDTEMEDASSGDEEGAESRPDAGPPTNQARPNTQTAGTGGDIAIIPQLITSYDGPSAPWSTKEVEAISEVIGQRCSGGSAEYLSNDEPGLNPVTMGYYSSELNETINTELDETRVFDMRELVSSDIDIRGGSQVRSRDVVQFVVLSKPISGSLSIDGPTPWSVPSTKIFKELINRAECFMIEKRLTCYKARKWSNMWGKVGVIGLSPRHREDMDNYRTIIEGSPTEELTFTLFPKAAVENRGSISIILREQFSSFRETCLPASLFSLNKGLRGSLRVTHTKAYGDEEKTRAGISKQGWRLILLQGCPEFMRSLANYHDDERFALGAGYIYIRGGTRKARPPSDNGTESSRKQSYDQSRNRAPRSTEKNGNRRELPHQNESDRRAGDSRGGRHGGRRERDASSAWDDRPSTLGRRSGPTPWGK